jgi:hypothetical protein
MYVVFFKGKGGIFDSLIRWWTKSAYSHCEFVFSDNVSFAADFNVFKTRFKSATYCKEDWDMFEVTITPEEEQKILNFCIKEKGCKYDIIGILFTQIIPISFESPWWWFCSEVCVAGFQQIGEMMHAIPHECDPNRLFRLLQGSDRIKTNWSNSR